MAPQSEVTISNSSIFLNVAHDGDGGGVLFNKREIRGAFITQSTISGFQASGRGVGCCILRLHRGRAM